MLFRKLIKAYIRKLDAESAEKETSGLRMVLGMVTDLAHHWMDEEATATREHLKTAHASAEKLRADCKRLESRIGDLLHTDTLRAIEMTEIKNALAVAYQGNAEGYRAALDRVEEKMRGVHGFAPCESACSRSARSCGAPIASGIPTSGTAEAPPVVLAPEHASNA